MRVLFFFFFGLAQDDSTYFAPFNDTGIWGQPQVCFVKSLEDFVCLLSFLVLNGFLGYLSACIGRVKSGDVWLGFEKARVVFVQHMCVRP